MPWFLCSISTQTCLKHDQPGIPQTSPVPSRCRSLSWLPAECATNGPYPWSCHRLLQTARTGLDLHATWSINFPLVEASNKPMLSARYLHPLTGTAQEAARPGIPKKNEAEVDRRDLLEKNCSVFVPKYRFWKDVWRRNHQNPKIQKVSKSHWSCAPFTRGHVRRGR